MLGLDTTVGPDLGTRSRGSLGAHADSGSTKDRNLCTEAKRRRTLTSEEARDAQVSKPHAWRSQQALNPKILSPQRLPLRCGSSGLLPRDRCSHLGDTHSHVVQTPHDWPIAHSGFVLGALFKAIPTRSKVIVLLKSEDVCAAVKECQGMGARDWIRPST
jgi:hypothetical protein